MSAIKGHLEYRGEELGIRVGPKWMKIREGLRMSFPLSGKTVSCTLKYQENGRKWFLSGLDGEVVRQGGQLNNLLVTMADRDYYSSLK